MFKRIGDNSHLEGMLFYIKSGQADPVYADRSFFYNQFGKFFWKLKFKFMASLPVPDFRTIAGCVHMTLNKMSIHPVRGQKAPFHIYLCSGFPLIEISFIQRFFYSGYPVQVFPDVFNSKANPVMCYTLINFK